MAFATEEGISGVTDKEAKGDGQPTEKESSMTTGYLSITDVARHLSVDDQTVMNWARQGRIRVKKFGPRAYRIAADELRRFENESDVSPSL